jgi:type IV secretion system protein VirB2
MKMFKVARSSVRPLLMIMTAMAVCSINAFAGGAGVLPWDSGMGIMAASLTGPVAYAISILSAGIGFGTLIFGGQLNDFARYSALSAASIGGLLLSAQVIGGLYGITGAIV